MFAQYKPFRNRLRRLATLPALETVWTFVQHLQFDQSLPPQFSHPDAAFRSKVGLGLLEWEFETLAREILANSGPHEATRMDDWPAVATLINGVKGLEAAAYRERASAGDVLFELTRIAHRQWPWQAKVDREALTRFFKLYDHPPVRCLVEQQYGMSVTQMYQIGVALAGAFQSSMYLRLPLRIEINDVAPDIVERFIDRFSADLPTLAKAARAQASFDVNWAYSFNPLRLHPLIRTADNQIAAPLTPLLLRRLFDGLYFDIVPLKAFGNAMGASFQAYVGEVIQAANRHGTMTLLAEQRYGPAGSARDSVDWIVVDASGTLFIECKVARMKLAAKTDLTSHDAISEELTRLASSVAQMYAALRDAVAGRYPHWQPGEQPIYPLVLTLDEWNAFGAHIADMLDERILAEFTKRGLDCGLLASHPYHICSIENFEAAIQIMEMNGIADVMGTKMEGERRLFPIDAFLRNCRPEEFARCRSLFPEIWTHLETTAKRT